MNLIDLMATLSVINETGITNVDMEGLASLVKTIIEFFSFGGVIGVGILLFSLVLKIIPLPLDIYSRAANKKNSLKMEKMKGELKKLQKQYANNKELYTQKMTALYKKEGYSQLASCLPTLFTLVFFIVVISSFNKYSSYANLEIYNNMAYAFNDAVIEEINTNYEDYYDVKYADEEKTVLKEIVLKEGYSLTDEEINAVIVKAQDAAAIVYKEEIKKYKFLWVENIWISDIPWKKSFIDTNSIQSLFTYSSGCKSHTLEHVLNDENIFKTLTGSALLNDEKEQVNGYLILVALSIVTMLLSQLVTTKQQKTQMELQTVDGANGQAAQMTKTMTWMMPIMFGFFAFMYSAAFSLYLIVSTVFSLLSTLVINKFVEKKFEKVAAKQEEEKYLKRYGNILKNKKDDN